MGSQKCRIKPRSLSISYYNMDGDFHGKKPLLRQFLQDNPVDILLLQETLLKPQNRTPRFPNYNAVRNDRVRSAGGGTLIYYKRSLHCTEIQPPTTLTNIECSIIRIGMTGHANINIASVYLPAPGGSSAGTLLQSDLEALFSLSDSTILAGDFNSKSVRWHSVTNSHNGLVLEDLHDRLDFDVVATLAPTRYPRVSGHNPSVLDIALLKNITLQVCSVEVLDAITSSDHRPVVLQLGPTDDGRLTHSRVVTDWKKLGQVIDQSSPHLDAIPDVITTTDETDCAISSLTGHLQASYKECSREVPSMDPSHRFELPEDMRQLMTERNRASRLHDNYPTDEARSRLRYLQRRVKERIAELRDERWGDLMSEMTPHHQAYWRIARSLKTDVVTSTPPLTRPDGSIAFDDDEKAECLADSLESQCSPSREPVDPDHLREVESHVERLVASRTIPPNTPLEPTTLDEVKSIIRDLKPRKAPGADGISNGVLKCLPTTLLLLLVSIFNACLANCTFPAAWKEAIVIGIPKPGKDLKNPSSYRPISLLSSLGKIYERILLKRLKDYIASKSLLPDEQFGFRPKHACHHQLHRLTEHILRLRRWGRPTGALFFDVAKAFDKVWHCGLISKLANLGLPDSLVHIIRDFLSNRTFRYKLEGCLSRSRPITAGVPQGAVLSPLLYSLYTCDIPKSPKVDLALFADDTALYTSDTVGSRIVRRLQSAADALGEWFKRWRIEVNPEKSTAVFFSKDHFATQRRKITMSGEEKPPLGSVSMYGKPIPWAQEAKYLGVTLDSKMTFSKHVTKVRNRAAFVLGRLNPMIGNARMSLRNKLTLYKLCVRPIMTYAGVVFSHIAPSHINRLQVIQNRFLKRATGTGTLRFIRMSDLHREFDLPSIRAYLKSMCKNYFEKAVRHPNPLVVAAADYPVEHNPPLRRRRPRHVLSDPDGPIEEAIARARAPPDPSQAPNSQRLNPTVRPPRTRHRNRVRRVGLAPITGTVRAVPGDSHPG